MIRYSSLPSVLIGLVMSCGGNVAHESSGSPEGSGRANGGDSSSDATNVGKVGGESFDGGRACPAAPPPSSVPAGCSENKGSGWVSVPCTCDLWLENSTPVPVTAGLQLTVVAPPDQGPSPSGAHVGEVAFDDPDASWFATWSKQPGNGDAFTVRREGGTTVVSVGEGVVAMVPVPLDSCTTRKGQAHVLGSATLRADAVLANGVTLATMARCDNPPARPPPPQP